MVTSNTKMGWNCDIDREKRKDNSNIPTAKWIPPQYAKQEVLTFRLETYVDLLKPWGGLLNVIWGALHLLRNTGNSGWDVNGTHVFRAFHWKVPGNNWNFKKVILFSRWKISDEKACSIYEFSQGITAVPGYSWGYLCYHHEYWWQKHYEWSLCQMEHILHSIDLSMRVSESFW